MAPRNLLHGLAIASVVVASSRWASAAGCCGESRGLGERLARAERAAATVSVRFRERIGGWNAAGDYVAQPDGDLDRELRFDASWLVRVTGSAQLGVSVPVLATWRSLGAASSSGGGVGDVGVNARYDLLPITTTGWVPGLAFTLGATLPTGRSPNAAHDALAADTTGLGAAEFRPGLAVEKDWASGFYAVTIAQVALRTGYHVERTSVELGPRWELAALVGMTWSTGVSIGLGGLLDVEVAPRYGGREAPNASRRRTAALLFVAYDVTRRWTALVSAQVDLPADELGLNESAAVAVAIGARYAWGSYD